MPSKSKPMALVVAGTPYVVDVENFTGVDWRDFRLVTGVRPREAMRAVIDLDMECIAAFVWLVRRHAEPKLDYLTVLESLSFATFEFGDAAEGDPPEA